MKNFQKLILIIAAIFLIPSAGALAKSVNRECLIILDAGHGGGDRGVKISGDQYEKDLTLLLAGKLKTSLEKSKNIRVILTRSEDKAVSFQERCQVAKNGHADLFLSLHINAGFDKISSGYEVYFAGFRSPAGSGNDSGAILKDMVQTRSMNDSVRYAKILQKYMEKVFPRKDRGLREGPILFQDLTVPAVVVELGFATNVKERKSLLEEGFRKSIVDALDQSVHEYCSSIGR